MRRSGNLRLRIKLFSRLLNLIWHNHSDKDQSAVFEIVFGRFELIVVFPAIVLPQTQSDLLLQQLELILSVLIECDPACGQALFDALRHCADFVVIEPEL